MAEAQSFQLRRSHLKLLRQLEGAFRDLLRVPDLSPDEIVGLARGIRAVQCLPVSSPDVDVSVSLEYRSVDVVSLSRVRLSSDQIEVQSSQTSTLTGGQELESGTNFAMTIGLNGEFDMDGDLGEFVDEFVASATDAGVSYGYTITVLDESPLEVLPPPL